MFTCLHYIPKINSVIDWWLSHPYWDGALPKVSAHISGEEIRDIPSRTMLWVFLAM